MTSYFHYSTHYLKSQEADIICSLALLFLIYLEPKLGMFLAHGGIIIEIETLFGEFEGE